jgi:hypothetical protein
MPYQLKKVKGGYKILNKYTGKTTSLEPMTLENAKSQMRLLEMIERKK